MKNGEQMCSDTFDQCGLMKHAMASTVQNTGSRDTVSLKVLVLQCDSKKRHVLGFFFNSSPLVNILVNMYLSTLAPNF